MSEEQEVPTEPEESKGWMLGCLGVVMLTGLAYWGALWLFDLNAEQAVDVALRYRIAGLAATFGILAMIGVMGETFIEDLVKVAMIDALAIVAWFQVGDKARTVLLGILVGATLMLVARLIMRRRS